MRDEYDFSNAKKNLYSKKLKRQITINLDISTIDYFKSESEEQTTVQTKNSKAIDFTALYRYY